jgi:hypothetical protein
VSSSNVSEGIVLYVDTNPVAQLDAGTNSDGTRLGFAYDTVAVTVPMRADFVAYSKSGYNECRHADGAGGWGTPTTGAITQAGTGTTREVRIPWTAVRGAGRPTSFDWTGYAVSNSSQYVYAEMPPTNPGGSVGAAVTFGHLYRVTDATPGIGTKPFSNDVTP